MVFCCCHIICHFLIQDALHRRRNINKETASVIYRSAKLYAVTNSLQAVHLLSQDRLVSNISFSVQFDVLD